MGQYQTNVMPAAAQTKSGSGIDQSVNGLINARFLLLVTDVAGTSPALDVTIEAKTKSGKYVTVASFNRAVSTTSQTLDVCRMVENFRISWVTAGTNPSFTFEIDAVYDVYI